MLDVRVDLADDRFDVTYSAAQVGVKQLLETVRGLGYDPEVVTTRTGVTEDTVERVDLSLLPKSLADVFAQAKAAGKPVLVHFTGPG